MAVDIELKANVLHVTMSGVLTDADFTTIGTTVEDFEAGLDIVPPRICDMSAVTRIDIGFDEVWALAHRRQQSDLRNNIRTALVVQTLVQRGIARMFQTLNDHPLVNIRIFDDTESALEWLTES